jgi:undecaprenyl phosphate N,N'-diacetylbacillosamine 1-phosphate transferase
MYKSVKRMLDFLFSILLIFILSPVILFASLIILLFMGAPVFFTQNRIGFKNKEFKIFKFRTMNEKNKNNLEDHQRITWIGKILRVTRIDELPQLFNIFLGNMSFIGPRPLLPEYLPCFKENELIRHEVRPGLSGLSQVFASYPSWEQQFEYDIEYVNKISFRLDVTLFMKTFLKVLFPSKKLVSGKAGRVRFDLYRKGQNKI